MSNAPLDGLDRVLDVAQETAASVDRDARFPQETVARARRSGPARPDGPVVGRRHRRRSCRVPPDRPARWQRDARPSAMIYLMHVCAAQVTLAGTPSGDSERPAWPGVGGAAGDARVQRARVAQPLLGARQPDRGREDHRAEVVRDQRRPREDVRRLDASRGNGRRRSHPASTWWATTPPASTSVPVGGPRAARQRERADDVRHAGRRGRAARRGGQGPRPDARRRPALVPARVGRGVARDRRGRGPGAAVAHVTGAKLEHLGQTLDRACRRCARGSGARRPRWTRSAGFLSDLARRMSEGDAAAPVLSAKAAANEMAIRVTSEIMQACGGAALSPALPMRAVVPRRARRVRDGADDRRPVRPDGQGARRHAVAVRRRSSDGQELMLGAVAYDQKVVPIWEGIREYFRGAPVEMDFVLFSELRGAGERAARREDRHRVEHEPGVRADVPRDRRGLPRPRDARHRRGVPHAPRRTGRGVLRCRGPRGERSRSAAPTRRRRRSCRSTT